MVDTIAVAKQSQEQSFEIVGRTAIYVFYSSYKHVRQLSRFGDVTYSSKKARYALLYVDTASLDAILPKLTELHFVREVKVSQFDQLNQDFSTAFQETVAIKKTADD